jgi:hypothetical protein
MQLSELGTASAETTFAPSLLWSSAAIAVNDVSLAVQRRAEQVIDIRSPR